MHGILNCVCGSSTVFADIHKVIPDDLNKQLSSLTLSIHIKRDIYNIKCS